MVSRPDDDTPGFVADGWKAQSLSECPFTPGTPEWKQWQHDFSDNQQCWYGRQHRDQASRRAKDSGLSGRFHNFAFMIQSDDPIDRLLGEPTPKFKLEKGQDPVDALLEEPDAAEVDIQADCIKLSADSVKLIADQFLDRMAYQQFVYNPQAFVHVVDPPPIHFTMILDDPLLHGLFSTEPEVTKIGGKPAGRVKRCHHGEPKGQCRQCSGVGRARR
jgi:hypothetical protein